MQGLGRQLTVVVLEGESITAKCLLSELHSHMALAWYMHSTLPMKPKWGSGTACFSVLFACMSQTTPPHFSITSWLATIGAVSPAVCVYLLPHSPCSENEGTFNSVVDSTGMSTPKRDAHARESSKFKVRPQVQRKEVQGRGQYERKQIACNAVDPFKTRPRGQRRQLHSSSYCSYASCAFYHSRC